MGFWTRIGLIGALILLVIIVAAIILGKFIFRDNPDYLLDHLKKHPKTTSLYVAENGEEVITYQSDIVRPLASTVKILIAVEYAMQVDEGSLDPDTLLPLEDLNQYYYKGSDGNAHEEWLEALEEANRIQNNEVSLHDVAKGMITFSSNANTDYLIDLLGIDSINKRAELLELSQHEEVYPLVAALLIPEEIQGQNSSMTNDDIIKEVESLSMEAYRDMARTVNEKIREGKINLAEKTFDMPMDLQKIWSTNLPGASAEDYGKLLSIISNNELPELATETVRDLMEWPLEVNEENKKLFVHIGSKGGSTGFILNNAVYVENHEGNRIESVLLLDDLSFWQMIMISNNFASFEAKLILDEDYRLKLEKELVK